MRRSLLTGLLLTLLAVAPAAAEYAPLDRRGPALSVPDAELRASLSCSPNLADGPYDPVLLVHGTTLDPQSNFGWNFIPAFDAARRPHCEVALLDNATGDIQLSAERVVHAIRTMHARAGRPIDIVGHSQGGMVPRWALRFWPDLRPLVDDLVGVAPSNHGTIDADVLCALPRCAAAIHQQAARSEFVKALNSGAETFGAIDYTALFTLLDEVVVPASSGALLGGGTNVTNLAVQDVCPGRLVEHLGLGTYDAAAYAVVLDALDHDGPARPARVDRRVCRQQLMPGVVPERFAGAFADAGSVVAGTLARAPTVADEPPLRCYVTAACPPATPRLALERRCSRGRLFVRVTGETGLVAGIDFKLGGHRVRSDGLAPFAVTIARRTVRRTQARRLRAVVRLAGSGEPSRLTLSRTLPRCD